MPLTPDQRSAIDPQASVWVSANAGTGKTQVLTSRVLRLMLEGVAPERILCLTFTNAAAAEMVTRIKDELAAWATVPEEALKEKLAALLNTPNLTPTTLSRARSLFLAIVDNPESLRIQTIHGFCQSLLRRFPLEAGVPPHFSLMDDKTSRELLNEAWQRLLSGHAEDDATAGAVRLLAATMADRTLSDLVDRIIAGRKRFEHLLHTRGLAALVDDARAELEVDTSLTASDILRQCITEQLPAIRTIFGTIGEWNYGEALPGWLALQSPEQITRFKDCFGAFLTGENKKRAIEKRKHPALQPAIEHVQDALLAADERCRALHAFRMTEAMLQLAHSLFRSYAYLKDRRAQFDYDDLILRAHGLLTGADMRDWVMFKLDGGIDHVLVDEAQDTSEEQWGIITALCGEFFTGHGAGKSGRTLFVVGDYKQSIFSFQGADPALFNNMRHHFTAKAREAGRRFDTIPMKTSFRSVPAILETVDAVFRQPELQQALGLEGDVVQHFSGPKRALEPGLVELWPLLPKKEKEEKQSWVLPLEYVTPEEPAKQLAENIADTLRRWLDERRMLAAEGRPVTPGDIMILVRRRAPMAEHLTRALMARGIPVAGADRVQLTEHIAVQDLLALGSFLLLPEDDLTLAALLKSPLIGIGEEELFRLAYGRKGSLWEQIKLLRPRLRGRQDFLNEPQANLENPEGVSKASPDGHPPLPPPQAVGENIYTYLSALLARADYESPLALYTHVLEVAGGRKAFLRRMGPAVGDVLDEFLNLAAQYGHGHTPSLQGFLHWVNAGKTEIKRDMEHGRDEVRILTVHGSKGLQAPIVFLPDSAVIPQKKPAWLLWTENGVLFCPTKEEQPARCRALLAACREEEERESIRLLYVAMTRASHELYICGHEPTKGDVAKTWHGHVRAGMATFCSPLEGEQASLRAVGGHTPPASGFALKDSAEAALPQGEGKITLPPFLFTAAPVEKPVEYATPSGHLPPSSPMAGDAAARRRGTFLHLLLQYLPDIPPERRTAKLMALAEKHLPEALPQEREALLKEAVVVLSHPDFAPIFSAQSRAEVPVAGRIGSRNISGQIDRLVVREEEVVVIDYKTSRNPPASPEDVPPAYVRQMADYRALVQEIYPRRKVRSVLLWTNGPRWMELLT